MRNAFRDFFRRIRVNRHLARNGPVFDYHGVAVTLPAGAGLSAFNALIRGKCEREEAAMIVDHLPADLPVIELGGSLGVVSGLIRSRLAPDTRHLVVEANPDLIDACARNAGVPAASGRTEVVNAALFYDAPVARFRIGEEVHSNALDDGQGAGRMVEVPAVTLQSLYARIGAPTEFVLVADIEGAEYDLFARETETLRRVALAIVELHPRDYARAGRDEASLMAFIGAAGLAIAERRADVVLLRRR
ncbi:MAG: FkbM family methyltransferase [Mesorhizobium sp.]|nr:FkbM family methyltransferase [Mesorhizobium sp.]